MSSEQYLASRIVTGRHRIARDLPLLRNVELALDEARRDRRTGRRRGR